MRDPETSFGVEVLGFPAAADPQVLAASVSEFFGISLDEGRRLVDKAPIRVKRNASAAVAQQLVRQLVKLGAHVRVLNEQTGVERLYGGPDSPRSRGSAPSMPGAPQSQPETAPAEETLPSEDDVPPEAEPPARVEVVDAAAGDEAAGDEAPGDEAPGDEAPGEQGTAPRAEPSSTLSMEPEAPRSSQPLGPASPQRLSSNHSLPPPSAPILSLPPPSAAKLDFCGSCARPVDKGETCSRCGWNNVDKTRSCRQCKGPLAIVSVATRRVPVAMAIGALSFALAILAFFLFGFFPAAAVLALLAGCVFAADALTLRYACKKCTVAVYTERLQKEEASRVRTARGKALSVAIACAAITGGLLAVTGFSGTAMEASSYGIAWKLAVPRTHTNLGNEVTSLVVPTGTKRMRLQYAQRPYVGGVTYALGHMQYTYPAGPATLDAAGLEAAVRQVAQVVYAGAVTGEVEHDGASIQANFTGTFHGDKVFGRVRGTQYDHDMMFVVVTASSPDDASGPAVDRFLSSLTVEHGGK